MKSSVATIGLTGILMVGGIAGAVVAPSTAMAQNSAPMCHFYRVNINGTVANNYASKAFSVTQFAFWRNSGYRSNPIEFGLKTFTDLNVNPQLGQTELMTNSRFANNAGIAMAKIDLARVTNSNQVFFNLDPGASLQLPAPNVFVSPGVGSSAGGLGGLNFLTGAGQDIAQMINGATVLSTSYLVPRQGGGSFSFTDNTFKTIVGQLDVTGTAIDNATLQGRYTARFSGDYVGSANCP